MKKILVADDTKNIRTLLTTCLEIEGYEVVTASDGQQALSIFTSQIFDLAFLDIKMPIISGTEVLKRVRDMGITTPVIIITAFATVKNAVECTKMGAVAYLQKPFTADKVRNILFELNEADCGYDNTAGRDKNLDGIEALIARGLYNEALAQLKKAISLDPAEARLYLLFSKAYDGMGDFETARKFHDASKLFKGGS